MSEIATDNLKARHVFSTQYLLSSSIILLSFPSTFLFISMIRSSFCTVLVFSTSARLREKITNTTQQLFLQHNSNRKEKDSFTHGAKTRCNNEVLREKKRKQFTCSLVLRSSYLLVSLHVQAFCFPLSIPPT